MQWFLLLILLPYIYHIFKISGALSKVRPFQPQTNPRTFVSVIVSCRDEEKDLPLLMSDIAGQTYNHDLFELIIIDDNSSDSTFKLASEYMKIKNLKVLKNIGNGKKKAVRTGVEASAGKLIITTDADCRMGSNWLKTIAAFQAENKPEMILCPVRLKSRRGFFNRFQELEFLSLQGITAGTAAAGNPVMCNGANLAYLKETYLKHGGNLHDELLSGEDIFLLHNVKQEAENKIMWLESPEASVTTGSPDTILSFIKQRARWISKAGSYSDRYTRVLAIVTFVTIIFQAFLTVAGFYKHDFLMLFLAALIIKSVSDYVILNKTMSGIERRNLMKWLLPSQVIYPFYVVAAVLLSVGYRSKW